jgi:hypothetical protein
MAMAGHAGKEATSGMQKFCRTEEIPNCTFAPVPANGSPMLRFPNNCPIFGFRKPLSDRRGAAESVQGS